MILAMAIGNTNFIFAQEGKKNIKRSDTVMLKSSADFVEVIKSSKFNADDVEGVIISSVVPTLTPHLIEAVQELFGVTPVVVKSDMNMALDLSAYNKKQLGNDRIAVCEAAIAKYTVPAIIFDFGTATTINIVDAKGQFLGGSILAGVTMGLDALSKNTAQLPKGDITQSHVPLIGSNTQDCLISGAVYGNAAMMSGMINRIENELGQKVTVLVTGGNSRFVLPFCESTFIYDENLQIKGLYELYNKNCGGNSFE